MFQEVGEIKMEKRTSERATEAEERAPDGTRWVKEVNAPQAPGTENQGGRGGIRPPAKGWIGRV